MKLQIGDVAQGKEPSTPPEGWQVIESPVTRRVFALAALIGLILILCLCLSLGTWASVVGDGSGMATAGESDNAWAISIVIILLFIPLHEFVHLLGQPGWGFTNRSIVAVWPTKVRFGVYYDGCMSRRRWLVMHLAPLIFLSFMPACILALGKLWGLPVDLELGLSILMMLNAIGSGADILAVRVVLSKVPRDAFLCFHEGKAYWRAG